MGGVVWQVYHVTGGLPIVVDLALEVDLFGEDMLVQNANELCVLKIVVTAIRKELKRTTRQSITQLKILRLLNATVVRPECLGSK